MAKKTKKRGGLRKYDYEALLKGGSIVVPTPNHTSTARGWALRNGKDLHFCVRTVKGKKHLYLQQYAPPRNSKAA